MRLSELCKVLGDAGFPADLDGEDRQVSAVNTIEEAGPGELAFVSNPRYLAAARRTRAAAVIARPGVPLPDGVAGLRCADPYAAVTIAIVAIHGHRVHPRWGISPRAAIDPSARLGADANVAPGVHIAAGVVAGDGCTFYPGCYVGEGSRLGDGCVLYPNVVIYDGCRLGDRVVVHSGSVIGEDGIGFAPVGERWLKIPQAGTVAIGDDVDIGANCSVDRAALGTTEIASGTKLGNSIVVAHGARIGANCMIVGQAGIAGSARLGDNVTLAGQTGVVGHLTVGDRVKAAARSVIMGDIPADTDVIGMPAVEVRRGRRILLAQQRLPDLLRRVRALEKELAELRARLGAPNAVRPGRTPP